MNTIRKLAATITTALLLGGGGIATTAASASSAPRLRGANESSTVRPTRFNPIINDGAGTVIKLRWSDWAGAAHAKGEFYTHKCKPNCAQGGVKLWPVKVEAWRIRGGNYTRFQYHFRRGIPHGQWFHGKLPRTWTIRYRNGQWRGKLV
jgi:hypothetical protein